jgi:hypothetical protein
MSALTALLVGLLLAAQAVPSVPQSDIVVEGVQPDAPDSDLPVRAAPGPSQSRRSLLGRAQIFARCVKQPNPALLRTVLDGMPRSAPAIMALDRLIRSNAGCFIGFTPDAPPGQLGDCDEVIGLNSASRICRAFYNRAALLEQALLRYVPDLTLTPRQTNDPVVQARFNAREGPRNRFRDRNDYQFYAITSCMVMLEPVRAIHLFHEDDPGRQLAIQNSIVRRGRACLGGAKGVSVDPTQFRVYVMDALYRWTVAVRGVETLVPDRPA